MLLFYHRSEGTSTGRKKIEDGFNSPQERYAAKHTTFIGLKLTDTTDADILSWLADQPNKQGAIKEVIRDYLKRSHRDG